MSSSARSSLAGVSEELGAELVTDGSFAAVTEGADAVSGWDLTSGWTGTGGYTASDANTYGGGAGAGGMYKAGYVTANLCYKVVIDISTTASGWTLNSYDGANLTEIAAANGTYYFNPADSYTGFYFRNNDAGTTDINTFTVELITFTNWTVGTGWAPQATAGALTGKAQKVAGTASDLEQDVSATAGKVYRVVQTLDTSLGAQTPQVGGVDGAAHSTADTFTDNIGITTSTGNLKFQANAASAGTVAAVSGKEITRRGIPD